MFFSARTKKKEELVLEIKKKLRAEMKLRYIIKSSLFKLSIVTADDAIYACECLEDVMNGEGLHVDWAVISGIFKELGKNDLLAYILACKKNAENIVKFLTNKQLVL